MNRNDVLKITKSFVRRTLLDKAPEKMCFTICYPLSLYLELNGIEATIEAGKYYIDKNAIPTDHYWLLLKDGSQEIIDPTIRQFEQENLLVYLGAKPDNFKPDPNFNLESAYKIWRWALLDEEFTHIDLDLYIPVNLRAAEILLTEKLSKANSEMYLNRYEAYFDCITEIVRNYNGKYGINSTTYPNLFRKAHLF